MVASKRTKSKARRDGSKGPGRKPIRPIDRQKMRPWLMNLLDRGEVPGLEWEDRPRKIFFVTWRHAARQGWSLKTDAEVFERWALHTGKFFEGDEPDPKRWKANFRCALHSLPDVQEIKENATRKGQFARRIYQFLDGENKGKKKSRGRRSCRRRHCDYDSEEETEDFEISEEEDEDEETMSGEECDSPPRPSRPTRFPRQASMPAPVHSAPPPPTPAPAPVATPTQQATQTSDHEAEEEEEMEFVESPILPKFDKIFPVEQSRRRSFAHTSVGHVTVNVPANPTPKPELDFFFETMQIKRERMTSYSSDPASPTSDRGSMASSSSPVCSPQHVTPGNISPQWGSEGEDSGLNMSDEEVVDLVRELESGADVGQYHPRLWNDDIIVDGQVESDFMNTDGELLQVHVVTKPVKTISDFNLTGIQEA